MLSLIAAVVAFQATPVVHGTAYPDIMPLSRVRAGMRGYGLTVFSGAKIERFDVTVVAVVRNGSLVAPGHDMILIRMSGGPMTGRGANLIRGMSGSPIYIGGKCIGAFSQGEPTSKEPLGGVTPIEDMLEAWDPKLPQKMEARAGGRTLELRDPLRVGRRLIRRIVFDAGGTERMRMGAGETPALRRGVNGKSGIRLGAGETPALRAETLNLQPCIGMMTLSGGSRRSLRLLREMMEPYGIEVVQAPAGGARPTGRTGALVPGAAFSAMLLTGDIQTGATGTVTYRRGEKLLGFGHPFLGVGPLAAPICPATIHDVYPLNAGSYKISTPGPPVGSTSQDRPFGISAVIGRKPPMIPISVEVDDRTTGRQRTFRMEAVPHPNLYSGLMTLAVGSAIADIHPTPGPVTARVSTLVEADQIGPIERQNTVFDARAIDVAASADLEAILSVLSNNPFDTVLARRAHVRCVIEAGRRTATLERASVNASRYEPGDTVEVAVTIRPHDADPVIRTCSLVIPEDVPNGPMTLTVRGGGAPAPISIGGIVFRPSAPSSAEQSPPASVRQMVDRLLEREKGDEVAVRLALPTTSVAVKDQRLTGLPPTLDAIMRSSRVSGTRLDRDAVKVVMQTDWVVTGQQTLTVNVQRPPAAGPAPGQTPGTGSGSSAGQPASGRTLSEFGFSAGSEIAQRPRGEAQEPSKGEVKPAQQKPPAAQDAKPKAETTVPADADKPVARVARIWRQSGAEWRGAKLQGVGVTSRGDAVVVPSARRLCGLPGAAITCIVSDGSGGVLACLSGSAEVFRISSAGAIERVAEVPEAVVTSLYRSPEGALYIGTGPLGRTYRWSAGSSPTIVHDADESYVLCLAGGPDSTVLIGTGGGRGSVYRLAWSGAVEVMAADLDRQVLSIGTGADGTVWAGTAGKGCLVRIPASGKAQVAFELPGQHVSAIAALSGGEVVAASAPKLTLHRFRGGTWSARQLEVQSSNVALHAAGDAVLVAAGSAAFTCGADDTTTPISLPVGADVTAAVVEGGRVWLGTANNGEVLMADVGSAELSGELESVPLDAGSTARWGKLEWLCDVAGQTVAVRTRSGDTSVPDIGWSDWASVRANGDVMSPPARYLQYEVALSGMRSPSGQGLREVTISYLPLNRPPTLAFQVPAGGERWSGKQTLKWQATDPDGDTLTYKVERSADGGATWQDAPGASKPQTAPVAKETPTKETPAKSPQTSGRPLTVAQVTEELDKHPNLPAAMREAILERTRKLNAEFNARQTPASGSAVPPVANTRETSWELDTSQLPDGRYNFRVTASDRAGNWESPKETSAVSQSVVVCNSPPVVYVLHNQPHVAPDGGVRLEFVAVQRHVPIVAAQWRVDGGEWASARPADSMADSGLERFSLETAVLPKGKHTVEVKVFNGAGLSSTEVVTVEIPAKDAGETPALRGE